MVLDRVHVQVFDAAGHASYWVDWRLVSGQGKDKKKGIENCVVFARQSKLFLAVFVWIWGAVENTTQNTYEQIKVIFTVKGSSGKFIGRRVWDTDPQKIKPSQIGYIDGQYVRCERKKPYYLEYNVTSD